METVASTNLLINTAGTLDHDLNSNPNGLYFGTINDKIPSINESGSLSITANASSVTNAGTGVTKTVTIKQYNRDYSTADTFNKESTGTGIKVGRFIDLDARSGLDSTTIAESFLFENYRWLHTTMGDVANANNNDPGILGGTGQSLKNNFQYWVDTLKSDFNSNQSILDLNELQVRWNGTLSYPVEAYTDNHLPNLIDYTTAGNDRYFYRAFDLGGTSQLNAFVMTVNYDPDYQIARSDIWANDPGANGTAVEMDSLDIRIDIKFPGQIRFQQNTTNPGTAWGSVTGGIPLSGGPTLDGWVSGGSISAGASNSWVMNIATGNWKSHLAGQVILMRVRFKANTTARITSINLAPL
jgi:hypothetical protein